MTSEPSGRLYSVVTKHWPKIASGLVVVLGIVELVAGGLTADSGVEFYLMVWAATTGGVWFFFEKAEQALGMESRGKVVAWVTGTDLTSGIESIPEQFRSLFDRAFGERQLSLKCVVRSSIASVVAVVVVFAFWLIVLVPDQYDLYLGSGNSPVVLSYRVDWSLLLLQGGAPLVTAALFSTLFNLVPDFLSLWETRAVTNWISVKRRSLASLLFMDLSFTTVVSAASVMSALFFVLGASSFMPNNRQSPLADWIDGDTRVGVAVHRFYEVATLQRLVGAVGLPGVPMVTTAQRPPDLNFSRDDMRERANQWERGEVRELWHLWPRSFGATFEEAAAGAYDRRSVTYGDDGEPVPIGIFFYSAFATSVWLWLHAAAVLLSHFLLRMNSGVGFLLRVTDVERQPFRSMGFVSVIIVSALFALGLPLVLM